jgi:hypothetical protein
MKPNLLLSLLLLPASLFGQEYQFEVVKTGTKYPAEFLNTSFVKANFCGRINPTQSYTIKFDDGAEVKVFSATESTISEKSGCVRSTDVDESGITWSISTNGTLLKQNATKPAKSHE